MDGKDYVANALRTEAPPDFLTVTGASPEESRKLARLLHALLGMVTEIGEIADVLKRRVVYGTALDEVNLVEEHGDESWYMAIFLDALGSSWDESWTRNIAKLKARFPKKFEAAQALNRDLAAERRALEGGGAAALNNVAGAPYRTAPTAPPQRHRETPPDQRHGFVPYAPCKNHCDDPVCLTVRTLQEKIAQLSIDNSRLRAHEAKLQAERDNWKRRAEQHGCDVVNGDPDCG